MLEIPDDAAKHDIATPSAGEQVGIDRAFVLVTILTLIYTCAFIDRNILSLLVDPIKADLKVTDLQVSLLLGASFALFYAILNIPAGFMVDRVGRRGLIAGAVVSWSGLTILCGLAATFWQLFLGRAGVGLAEAFITPACFALIRDRVVPERRGRAFSVLGMAPYIGSALALVVGGALIGAAQAGRFHSLPFIGALSPWQAVLAIVGLAGLPMALLVLALKPDRRNVARGAAGPAGGVAQAFAHVRAHATAYVLLEVYASAGALLAFGNGAWIPAMMSRRFAIPLAKVGPVSGLITLAAAVSGLLIGGMVLDRIAAKRGEILYFGLFMLTASVVAFTLTPLTSNQMLAWTSYGASIFFAGSYYAVGATVLSQITPSQLMGKVTAIYLMVQTIVGSALGPTLVAAIAATFFSGPRAIANALSIYCALSGVVGIAAVVALTRHLRRRNVSR